jgi:hypothetical protein
MDPECPIHINNDIGVGPYTPRAFFSKYFSNLFDDVMRPKAYSQIKSMRYEVREVLQYFQSHSSLFEMMG